MPARSICLLLPMETELSWVFPHLPGCIKVPPGREGEISASGVQPGIKKEVPALRSDMSHVQSCCLHQ